MDKNIFPNEIRINTRNSLPLDVTEDKNFVLYLLDVIIDAQKMKYVTKITGTSRGTKTNFVFCVFFF